MVGPRQVAGDTERHTALLSVDDGRRLGIAPLEATAEVVVQAGRIKSFRTALTPASLTKLQAATSGAGPVPTAMPRTGDRLTPMLVLLGALLFVVGFGAEVRRKADGGR